MIPAVMLSAFGLVALLNWLLLDHKAPRAALRNAQILAETLLYLTAWTFSAVLFVLFFFHGWISN